MKTSPTGAFHLLREFHRHVASSSAAARLTPSRQHSPQESLRRPATTRSEPSPFRSRRRTFASTVVITAFVFVQVSSAGVLFDRYGLAETFSLPAGAGVFDVTPPGRLVTLVGSELFIETAVQSRSFVSLGSLPAADINPFGAAFLRVSPDGTRIAVGNNGGASGADFRVGVFQITALTGTWFTANHSEAEWFDPDRIALTAANAGVGFVTLLDVNSPDPANPTNPVVIAGIDGFSGGVTFNDQGDLFCGNGFQPGPPDKTGQINRFAAADWLAVLGANQPLDFESQGTLIIDLLSASSLGFDEEGNLLIGGGDLFGSGQGDFAAVVAAAAVTAAASGSQPIDPDDPDVIRRLDPDQTGDFNFYALRFNPITRELYLKDFGPTVYVYRISNASVPAFSTAASTALALVIVLFGATCLARTARTPRPGRGSPT